MAVNAGSVYVDLGARLDKREFEAYERELKKVQERTARREQFKAQLGANFDPRAFNAYERELNKASRATEDHVKATGRLRTAFGSVYGRGGGALAAVGATYALGTAIRDTVGATVDFDKSMRNVNSIAQLSEKQLGSLSKSVLQLAGQTAQAPKTLADGLYDLVSSGFDANQSLTILRSSAKAATAGLTDTATSTKAVAAVLNAYHRPAKDAADVSDTLFQTVNRGVISFEELSTTIGDVLPFASSLKIPLKDVGAATSTMTKEGINGFETMTRLKNLFEAFIKPSDALSKAIKATGAANGEALVQSKGFQGALEAVISTTDGSKNAVAQLFPNIRALGGALALTGSNAKSAHGDLKAFADTSGATNKALSQQSQSIAFQWQKVKAQLAATSIELGANLGPAAIKAMSAVSRFVDQMNRGVGTGGAFVHGLQAIIFNFRQFGLNAARDVDTMAGWTTTIEGATGSVLNFAGTLIGGRAGGRVKEWGKTLDDNRQDIDRWRQELRIKSEVDQIDLDIDRLRDKVTGGLRDIRVATQRNMDAIRSTMGEESAAGQKALHDNFQAAVDAIRSAMRRGEVSTRTGLAQIRSEMLNELRTLGIDSAMRGGLPLSKNPPKGDLPVTTSSPGITKYGGGWIGMPGMVGPDVVPAMLAPGEAVLNRHQQAVIEGMLGDGFLDRLFATVQRPHYMDRGGRIPFAAGGLAPAVSRLANSLASRFGLTITSTTGGTHAPGSYHYQGLAADLGGSPGAMSAASAWLMSSGTYKSLLEGIHDPGLSVKNGQQVAPSFWGSVWPQHANHVHIALRALGAIAGGGGGMDAVVKAIRAPRVGGSGALHDIVQGVLDRTARGATSRVRALAASMGGGDITSQGLPGAGATGGGGNAANRRLARGLLRAFGWDDGQWGPLQLLWNKESGFSTTAKNPSSGAYGIPQSLPASKMATVGSDYLTNPATQIRWGLGYIRDRYGSPAAAWAHERAFNWYSRGGPVRRFNGGGRAGPFSIRHAASRSRPFQPWGASRSGGGSGTHLDIAALRSGIKDSGTGFDSLMAQVEDQRNLYDRVDARYNLTEEDFIDANGEIDFTAVKRKAAELQRLQEIRNGIEHALRQARVMARRAVRSYRTIIGRLQRSLRHAKGKDRKGIQTRIDTYQARLDGSDGWIAKEKALSGDIYSAHTDALEIAGELRDVYPSAQQAYNEAHPADTTADTSGGDTGVIDTPAAPTAADIAAGVIQQLSTFNQGRADLLTQFGANAITPRQAYMPGGVFSGSPDELNAAAGVRHFGATGGGTLGGSTVIANFASAPDNAPTFVQQMRFLVENGTAG